MPLPPRTNLTDEPNNQEQRNSRESNQLSRGQVHREREPKHKGLPMFGRTPTRQSPRLTEPFCGYEAAKTPGEILT